MTQQTYQLNLWRIKMRMRELDLNRKALAHALGINPTTLWRYLSGQSGNNLRIAKAMAVTLDLPLEDVILSNSSVVPVPPASASKNVQTIRCPLCECLKQIA